MGYSSRDVRLRRLLSGLVCTAILWAAFLPAAAAGRVPGPSIPAEGKVVDAKGAGVEDAEVIACRGTIPRGVLLVNPGVPGCATELARTLSTAEGTYKLQAAAGAASVPLSAIVVRRAGYFPAVLTGTQLRATNGLTIRLSPAPSALKVRLIRPDGTPVAKAGYGWLSRWQGGRRSAPTRPE